MTVREILLWPDPCLRQPCRPVSVITEEVRALAADLLETMYAASGRGLAAPQVGVTKRMFVMDVTWKEGPASPRVCIDPEITWVATRCVPSTEGCLSLPGITVPVTRAQALDLQWTDLNGRAREERLSGSEAICAQHELDHLDGRVTLDRVDAEVRAQLEAAYGETPE